MGALNLEVPRLRNDSYMPLFLENHTRCERALMAVVQEAILTGVSTRKIQKVAAQMGITSLSKSQRARYGGNLTKRLARSGSAH
jgi:transposase-like protein